MRASSLANDSLVADQLHPSLFTHDASAPLCPRAAFGLLFERTLRQRGGLLRPAKGLEHKWTPTQPCGLPEGLFCLAYVTQTDQVVDAL